MITKTNETPLDLLDINPTTLERLSRYSIYTLEDLLTKVERQVVSALIAGDPSFGTRDEQLGDALDHFEALRDTLEKHNLCFAGGRYTRNFLWQTQ